MRVTLSEKCYFLWRECNEFQEILKRGELRAIVQNKPRDYSLILENLPEVSGVVGFSFRIYIVESPLAHCHSLAWPLQILSLEVTAVRGFVSSQCWL